MTTPRVQPVPLGRPPINAAPAPEGPFVINLCSSTTPVALSQPQDPELKRFSFFVSRRLEDGRERFRLHMGYFETLPEAEEWLTVVREVYPGAWAGETPGKRLRGQAPAPGGAGPARPESAPAPAAARSTPAAAARPPTPKPQPARPQPPTVFPPPSAATSVARPAGSGTPRAGGRPAAAPPAAARSSIAVPAAASARGAGASPLKASPAKSLPGKPATMKPGAPNSAAQNARPANAATPKTTAPGSKAPKSANVSPLPRSNVREVLASLDETGSTQQMPALDQMPTFKQVPALAKATRSAEPSLSDSQVLKLLETRRSGDGRSAEDSSISVLRPDDTGTRRELREAVESNAPVSFAVQLQWSVQPIEIAKVPPLAIFSAYTLYTVEGSREGRRWYGLRLGFFTDAISAKQVAQYVRSEFASVAVVPVGGQERARATATSKERLKSSTPAAPVLDKLPGITEFKLIDEPQTPPAAPRAGAAAAGTAKDKAPTPKAQAAASSKRASKGAGRVRAREKRSPQTLEETLEILGADQLEIDEGRGETLNDTGVRHLKVEVRKHSPFTKLLDRLSERARRAR
jgi:hypothetical protein